MTDVEDRVILGLKEQGEVGGKMVVYKDFTVERLCSQYFDQLYQARLLSWEGGFWFSGYRFGLANSRGRSKNVCLRLFILATRLAQVEVISSRWCCSTVLTIIITTITILSIVFILPHGSLLSILFCSMVLLYNLVMLFKLGLSYWSSHCVVT